MTTPTLLAPPAELNSLVDIAQELVAGDKGLLAIDESIPTCNKRFARLGITQDEPARRTYRELILTTPGLGNCISGVILYDETIRQHTSESVAFLTVLAEHTPARCGQVTEDVLHEVFAQLHTQGVGIREPALTIWDGPDANVGRAQQALLQRSMSNRDARRGDAAMTDATAVAGPPVTTSGPAQPAPTRPVEAHLLRAEGTA